ncbi:MULTISPECIES: hypothetical protein [Pseudomonas]|uniref:Uncharacterized protein n=2 Tax=Pseudomonas TaxID=286 RepID=A0A3M3DU40_9PSED|nr:MULTISPECIES: hypothetical protein [Pseudomonas]KPW98189.1 hypothetical protein ALO79_200030 [Pseudomonas syringae pv. castaneae]RMM39946.1 hypothetical protein ALQ77_04159 [Pseudomonas corrugata]SDV04359.1 hypothetical protein SAMN04490183_3610 [Pseudomonas corrugata]
MNSASQQRRFDIFESKSMQEFGEFFVESLPKHIRNLKIPGRTIFENHRREPSPAHIVQISELQDAMLEVLRHPITQEAHFHTESAFRAFLRKQTADPTVLMFFNGWNETHKTTSLVSAKIIMRLSADAISLPAEKRAGYNNVMAHMHEVVKDDFGLGHQGHDGMYEYMTSAFGATAWVEDQYKLNECNEFSQFLYDIGVAEYKSPLNSAAHKGSILDAMMVSISSELWNGREYNFIAQHIENKLLEVNPDMRADTLRFRNAKSYVMGHAGEVENKHGLHALAAAQAYGRTVDINFKPSRLKGIMLSYNERVGKAFAAMHRALSSYA